MFAKRYIELEKEDTVDQNHPEFSEWFLKGALRFGNAYICSLDRYGKWEENEPVPLSFKTEKNWHETPVDLLFEEPGDPPRSVGGYGKLIGHYDDSDDQDEGEEPEDRENPRHYLFLQEVKKSLNFHHQHDSSKGIVKQGIFFNYEDIAAHQAFSGDIYGEEQTLNKFKELFAGDHTFRIGRSRGTQYGRVKFDLISGPDKIKAKKGTLKIQNNKISMTFLSPVILYNKYGHPTATVCDLEKVLKSRINEDVKIEKMFAKTHDSDNYVAVWKLKRPSKTCFAPGSCFLVKGVSEKDIKKLEDIMKTGIGERKNEGFGCVRFGMQQPGELIIARRKPPTPSYPSFTPDTSKSILEEIFKETVIQKIALRAVAAANQFKTQDKNKEAVTKTLISRLAAMLTAKEGDKDDFRKAIGELRDTARQKLEKCKNGKQTLLEFITDTTWDDILEKLRSLHDPEIINLNQMLSDPHLPDNFCADLWGKKEFESLLYLFYFSTFFSTLRQKLKTDQIKEKGK
jgi:CRISPR-associated protein Csx10